MLKKAVVVAGAAASFLALAPMAHADGVDVDANLLNDNNISALPIQVVDNNIAVIGSVVPSGVPETGQAINAPVLGYPSFEG